MDTTTPLPQTVSSKEKVNPSRRTLFDVRCLLALFMFVSSVMLVVTFGLPRRSSMKFDDDEINQAPKNVREKRNVFFDFGANNGDSLESFVGNKSAAGGKELTSLGKEGKWDLWGFEANPFFNDQLTQLKDRLEAVTLPSGEKQYNVFMKNQTAITTEDGRVTFFLDTVNGGWKNYWGSSLFPHHRDVVSSGQKTKITVDAYGVSGLIMDNYSMDDYIVVKLDAEGIEYDILIDLMKTGAINYVDLLLCEYHDWMEPYPGLGWNLRYILTKMGVKQGTWK